MVADQLFGGKLGDREGVDELDDSFFLVQPAGFILAFLQDFYHILRIAQDLRESRVVLCLKVDLRHFLLDVGKAERDVLINRHVRPQRVVLEQEADFSFVRRDVDPFG